VDILSFKSSQSLELEILVLTQQIVVKQEELEEIKLFQKVKCLCTLVEALFTPSL
jgi:hypothetical protein